MADLYEIRRGNLRALILKHGNGEIAKAAGYPTPSYLSQMVGAKSKRGITEKTARRIEEALLLPLYWLDQVRDEYGNETTTTTVTTTRTNGVPHVAEIPTPGPKEPVAFLNQDHFADCAYVVSAAMAQAGVTLPKSKFATVVTMLMNSTDQSDEAQQKLAEQLIALSM